VGPLDEALRHLLPGPPLTWRDLTVLPLLTRREVEADYLLLDEALQTEALLLVRPRAAGDGLLMAVNRGPRPVLAFIGDSLAMDAALHGVCSTAMLPPGRHFLRVTTVPLTGGARRAGAAACVSAAAGGFGPAPSRTAVLAPPRVRAVAALPSGPICAVDRHTVHDALAELVPPSLPASHMVAAAVFSAGVFVCLDGLWPAAKFARLYPKLIRGHALEALGRDPAGPRRRAGAPTAPPDPEALLLRLLARLHAATAASRGGADPQREVRVVAPGLTAVGVVHRGELVQLSMFAS